MSSNLFTDVIAKIDVIEWLDEQGITYKKSASGQLNLRECPFCGDNSNRVYMRADNGTGLCFRGSCGAKFSFWSFVKEYLHTDSAGTARHFQEFGKSIGINNKPVSITYSNESWVLPLSIPLPTSDNTTHPMLIERKITLSTQETFGLRWCSNGSFMYPDLHSGEKRFMSFSNRIIIPVFDVEGILQTFQGRDVTGTSEKKYLFPPNLPGSGRFLYGANLVRGVEHLVLNEGVFDVMATHQAIYGHLDFKNVGVVGSFGLSIGSGDINANDQLACFRQLRREGLKRVTIMWDGEKNALNAALENGMLLNRQDLIVNIALLPQNKDPNEVDSRIVRETIQKARLLTPANYLFLKVNMPYHSPSFSSS